MVGKFTMKLKNVPTIVSPTVYYISNEYNRNAGLAVDMCRLLISIPSLVRFSLLILEAARRLIREVLLWYLVCILDS